MPKKRVNYQKPSTGPYATHLKELYDAFPLADSVLRNGHLLARFNLYEPISSISRNVVATFVPNHINDKPYFELTRFALQKVQQKSLKLRKFRTDSGDLSSECKTFCNSEFIMPPHSDTPSVSHVAQTCAISEIEETSDVSPSVPHVAQTCAISEIEETSDVSPSVSHVAQTCAISGQQSSAACASTSFHNDSPMKTRNFDYKERLKQQSAELKSLREKYNKSLLRKLQSRPVKRLKEKVERKSKIIIKLRDELTPKRRENLNTLRRTRYAIKKHSRQSLQKLTKALQMQLTSTECRVTELEDMMAANKAIPETVGSTYSPQIRMLVYMALDCNAPISNIGRLISGFSRMLDVKIDKVPSRTTVSRMAIELNVISDLKVAEYIVKTPGLTLGMDATTQEGIHINVINVHKGDDMFTLDVAELAGGKGVDYRDHITRVIDYLSELHSRWNDTNCVKVKQQMISNVDNVMTDRAVVNAHTILLLSELWKKELTQLLCHLHPLDTISTELKEVLKKLEGDHERSLPKTGCIVYQVMHAFNRLRFADNLGDPRGMRLHLVKNNLPKGVIQRERGNRLHLMFQQSEVHVRYRAIFVDYLQKHCHKNIDYLGKLISDYQDPLTVDQFQSLAVVSQLLSRPWMKAFYCDSSNSMTYVGAIRTVKNVSMEIEKFLNRESRLADIDMDFFGNTLEKDEVWIENNLNDRVHSNVKAMMVQVNNIIKRQYTKVFQCSDEELEELATKTKGAMVNNIPCEELVGMQSALKAKAPNATLLYNCAKIKSKKNKVLPYLESLPVAERDRIIQASIALATEVKCRSLSYIKEMNQELQLRSHQKIQEMSAKDRRKLEASMRAIKRGGIPTTVLKDCSISQAEIIQKILKGDIINEMFMHMWSNVVNDDVEWTGVATKYKKTKHLLVIDYWTIDGDRDNAESYDVSVYELASDYYKGDLLFI